MDRRFLIFIHDILAIFLSLQIASWIVLKDVMHLLIPGFVLKQSLIFALIASGFFLWFQTYRAVWRYISWRQAAILVGVLGFSSLIFLPVLTKANMQSVQIPATLVAVNWLVASIFLIGSRFFFRLFYERWFLSEEQTFSPIPQSRILLLGNIERANAFIRQQNMRKNNAYEIMGIIDSNPATLGKDVGGVEVLGVPDDLPDLIESFNHEGLHPHHCIIVDPNFLGKTARELVKQFSSYQIDFLQAFRGPVKTLVFEDLFSGEPDFLDPSFFFKKRVLIYGASSPLGYILAERIHPGCAHMIVWDHDVQGVNKLMNSLPPAKLSLLTQASYSSGQLLAYLKRQPVDYFINLRPLQSLLLESKDPGTLFETYITDNEKFMPVLEQAGVKHYFFVTQEAPHYPLSKSLTPVASYLFKQASQESKTDFSLINLPYIVHQDDTFFNPSEGPLAYRKQHVVKVPQDSLLVTSPLYGAAMFETILDSLVNKTPLDPQSDFILEEIRYEEIVRLYHTLQQDKGALTSFAVEPAPDCEFKWDDKAFAAIKEGLDQMNYAKALRGLAALMPLRENIEKKESGVGTPN
jgi:hypothetical protein